MYVERADGNREDLDCNRMYTFNSGDTVTIISSGGAGYGSPRERDPERVLADVRNGLVSVDQARDRYGVAIVSGSRPADFRIDAELTRSLRSG
jgi:N-methylhydantoinase B